MIDWLIRSILHHFDKAVEVNFAGTPTGLVDHFLYFILGKAHVQLVADSLQLWKIDVPGFGDVDQLECHFHFLLEIGVHQFPKFRKALPLEQ